MPTNPLNTNELEFWLRFNSLNNPNWYQISEPIGFDACKFVVEQEPNRFARSIKYGAIDKLRFVDTFEGLASATQTINPQGDQSNHLDYGLQWLLYIFGKYGFELDFDFKITINGVDFKVYGLDANDKDITDGYTYFQCKLIDNSNVMDYKRRYDDKLNMFADKGVFGQTIAPLSTFKYLKRATEVSQTSDFSTPNNLNLNEVLYGLDAYVYNPAIQSNTYGILNTLNSFEVSTYDGDTSNTVLTKQLIQERGIVKAKRRIVNLKIDIVDLNFSAFINSGLFANHRLRIAYGTEPLDDWTTIDLFTSSATSFILTNQNYSVTIPFLEIGQKVWLYFSTTSPSGLPSPTPITSFSVSISNSLKINLSAQAVSLDTVVPAVRLVDLYKQSNLMFRNLPFFAPLLDVGGKYHNQAIFNKSTVSQRVDNMYTTFKDLTDNLMECCQDVELLENEMFINEFETFYTNDEIGVYTQVPSEETSIDINERTAVNRLDFMYSKFAQDRELLGTNQSVHTQSQNRVQNDKVENKKEIKVDFVRDPLEIQNIVDLEISKPTTSTDNDDTLMLEEMTQLAPNSFGTVAGVLLIRTVNGRLEILNRDSSGDSGDTVINWLTLGFGVGSSIQVLNGNSAGNYIVFSVTNSVLTITPQFALTPIPTADYFISLKYFYSGVLWQTRTNQGFSLINGVGNKFGNLNFTIKRNLMRWFKYIASFVQYNQKDIINTYFKNNGALQTQLTTESTPVTEDADILFSQLPTPILTGKIINITVVSDWQTELDYLAKYELPNTTGIGSLRRKGFERVLDLKGNVILGYCQNRAFNIATNELNLTLEEKYSPQILKVDVIGSDLFVNDVRYNLSGNANWFGTQNNFIQFFDVDSKAICNLYEYNFVSLQSVIYPSINDLVLALNALI